MEDNADLIKTLLEKAEEYGKSEYELIKLQALDKAADIISSYIPHLIVLVLMFSFLLFLSLGLAFWLGEVLDNTFYGFFVIAGFYGIVAVIIHFFLHTWLKKIVGNNFIRQMVK